MPTSLISTGLEFPDASVQTSFFPTGTVLIWSGSTATIPTGWFLCDGNNGTPNLTDKFIIGAGSAFSIGDTGGSADAFVALHTHNSVTSNTSGVHNHVQASPHTHSITGSQTSTPGGIHTHPDTSGGLGAVGDTGPHTHPFSFNTSTFAAHTHSSPDPFGWPLNFLVVPHNHTPNPSQQTPFTHSHYVGRINHYFGFPFPGSTTRPAMHSPSPNGLSTATSGTGGEHTHSYTQSPAGQHAHPVTIAPANHNHGGFTGDPALTLSGDHTHPTPGGTISPDGSHSHPLTFDSIPLTTTSNGEHTHDITVNPAGSSATNANLPPYYALAYIMKSN